MEEAANLRSGNLAGTGARGTHHGQERSSSINRPDRLMQTKRFKNQKTLADRGRTIDGLPVIERSFRYPVLARQVGRLRSELMFL